MGSLQINSKTSGKISANYNMAFHTSSTYMEKIRSGQTFLYRDGGQPSMVIDARMKDNIWGNSLKKALKLSLLRYPYLTCKIIEKNGDFYLVDNSLPFIVKETARLHSLGSAQVNYHLIDITYIGKTIHIAFHHGLCDGGGIMPFVKTLIYYYCTLKYQIKLEAQGIRLADEPLLQYETAEPLSKRLKTNETQLPNVQKDGFVLPDSINSIGKNRYFRYEVKIQHERFMKFAKENNATPAIAISLFVSKAIKSIYPVTDKPVICNLASNLRKGINMENTFKNCVGSICLLYPDEFESMAFKDQAAAYRKILKDAKNKDNLKREINKQIYLYDKVDELHSYEEKKKMLSFLDDLITNTYVLSYVGQTQLGDCEKYIDSFHAYTSGTVGLTIQMMSVGEFITINFMQSFNTDQYINAFAQNLEEAGLEYTISNIIEYSIPKDSIMAVNR